MTRSDGANEAAQPAKEFVGGRIRQLRGLIGLTQDQLAEAARAQGFGWARATLADIEAGKRELSATEFLSLPDLFNAAMQAASPPLDREPVTLADFVNPAPGRKVALSGTLVVDRAGMRELLGLPPETEER
jgi:transcriptional regulator with XRE-family HTH domain